MSQDKSSKTAGARASQKPPASARQSRDDPRKPVPTQDADKAEPAPHERPVRTDDKRGCTLIPCAV